MLRLPFSMITQYNSNVYDFEYILSYTGLIYVFDPASAITFIDIIRLFQS